MGATDHIHLSLLLAKIRGFKEDFYRQRYNRSTQILRLNRRQRTS